MSSTFSAMLVFIQALLGVAFSWLGVHMSNHPPATQDDRKRYLKIFVVLGAIALCAAGIQFFGDQKKEAESVKQVEGLKSSHSNDMQMAVSNITRTFQVKYDSLQSNQTDFQLKQERLIAAAMTNTSMPIETRQRIFESQKGFRELDIQTADFAALLQKAEKRLSDKAVERALEKERKEKATFENAQVDSFVRKLEAKLVKYAAFHGDTLISNYQGLPIGLPVTPTNFAEMRFKTNSAWRFCFNYDTSPGWGYLKLICEGGSLEMGNFNYIVVRAPERDTYNISGRDDKALDEAFEDLIVSQEKQMRKNSKLEP